MKLNFLGRSCYLRNWILRMGICGALQVGHAQSLPSLDISMESLSTVTPSQLANMLPSQLPSWMAAVSQINSSNFLAEVQRLVTLQNTRDLVQVGKEAARLSLRVEELQIGFLQRQICTPQRRIPLGQELAQEIQLGCSLLAAQAELNKVKQRALDLMTQKVAP